MSKWATDGGFLDTRYKSGTKYEWNGYMIESQTGSMYRWWVTQGSPAPYRSKFEYLNDAKEACEVACRSTGYKALSSEARDNMQREIE